MGRMYSVSFADVAVTAVQDLFQIEANNHTILHAIYISQRLDVGDAEAEALLIQIAFVTDAVTNVAAETLLDPGSAVAGADLVVNDVTQLVTGFSLIHAEMWNIAMPFVYLPPPELRPVIEIANALVVDLATAPTDSLTMAGTMYFEEIG